MLCREHTTWRNLFKIFDTLLYFEMRVTQRGPGSTVEAKFSTFSPRKICGGTEKCLSEFFKVRPLGPNL